jgi:hypothetical protein
MTDVLRDLAHRARLTESDRELAFLLVNDTLTLTPYRQAVLWLVDDGVWALSGLVQVDANVPYTQWLDTVCQHMQALDGGGLRSFQANDLPSELSASWAEWWPEHALWLGSRAVGVSGAGILVRDHPWQPVELALLQEWAEVWWHAFAALHRKRAAQLRGWRQRLSRVLGQQDGQTWWRQRRIQLAVAWMLIVLWPVRLTVLAPGELVPAHPLVIRAPLDGVIDVFHVQPNQQVTAEQPLFSFDEIVIQSRLDVALQTLATAETDYRQTTQLALSDNKSKTQLGLLAGKVEERRAEIEYLQEQLKRARVLAPQAGVVLMDDPSEWIGKPVATGERILRIATLDDVEVEAWVSVADAIELTPGDTLNLHLSASPLSPVSASLRYMAHDAVQRSDGTFAYRVRAVLEVTTMHRVGLKGTAKLYGNWVPLSYWVLRRPLATARAWLGW